MANTRKPATTAGPADALAAASAQLDTARAAHHAATAACDDLTARLTAGDATITATDMVTADAETHRTAALLAHAETQYGHAQARHRIDVATSTAASLAEGAVLDDLSAAVDDAFAAVTTAVNALRSRVASRNAAVATAVATAESAGLVAGEADPLSPVLVHAGVRPADRALMVDGERLPLRIDADALVGKVLDRAAQK